MPIVFEENELPFYPLKHDQNGASIGSPNFLNVSIISKMWSL